MRLLLTSDPHIATATHFITQSGARFLRSLKMATQIHQPDIVVVAGDIAEARTARFALCALRNAVGDRPLSICLGNHDYWVDRRTWDDYPTYAAVRSDHWIEPCKELGITLLDEQNAEFDKFTIVGGYGHYDLGIDLAELKGGYIQTLRNVRDHLYPVGNGPGWSCVDRFYFPHWESNLKSVAQAEACGVEKRLKMAIENNKKLIVATHTCAWPELSNRPLTNTTIDYIKAFSVNSSIGKILKTQAKHIDLVVCAHTHFEVKERSISGIDRCLNIGSANSIMHAVLYDTTSKEIIWITP